MERIQQLSIHVAEFVAEKHEDTGEQIHHTGLLVRNDDDAFPGVLHQLHYNAVRDFVCELNKSYIMVPSVRNDMREKTFNKLAKVEKVDEGHEIEVRQRFNHILKKP